MKILDAAILIAISKINRPDLVDKLLKLGHELLIPYYVLNMEIISKPTSKIINDYINHNKFRVININTYEDIEIFRKDYPGLGLGECDTMLTYQKLIKSEKKVYCIFDDGQARTQASKLDIKYKGLFGLLKLLVAKKIMDKDECSHIIKLLKKTDFWLPTDILI